MENANGVIKKLTSAERSYYTAAEVREMMGVSRDTAYRMMGKASLADIVSGIPAPTKEEVEAAEAENAKPVKQKAREKLEAEKKKATQKNFADPVITYLMKRCEEDQGLAEDVMQEGKTWNNRKFKRCSAGYG